MMILEQKLNKYKQGKEDLGGVCAALMYNRVSSPGKRNFLVFLCSDIKIIFSIIVLFRFWHSWGKKKGAVPSFIGWKLKYRTIPLWNAVFGPGIECDVMSCQKVPFLHLTINQPLFCQHFHETGTWKLQSKCGLKLNRQNNLGSRAFLPAF